MGKYPSNYRPNFFVYKNYKYNKYKFKKHKYVKNTNKTFPKLKSYVDQKLQFIAKTLSYRQSDKGIKKTIPLKLIQNKASNIEQENFRKYLNINKQKTVEPVPSSKPKILHILANDMLNKIKSNVNLQSNSVRYIIPKNFI